MASDIQTVYTYRLDGLVQEFNIPFDYLSRKFVKVTLIGETRRELTPLADYRFISKTEIRTNKIWGATDGFNFLEVRRFTSATERIVDFSDGSILRASDLNVANVQSLHIAEEARGIAADSLGLDGDGNLDARGRKIVNLGNPTGGKDAANYEFLKATENSIIPMRDQVRNDRDEVRRLKTQTEGYKAEAYNYSVAAREAQKGAEEARDLILTKVEAAENAAVSATESANESAASKDAAALSASEAAKSAELSKDSADKAKISEGKAEDSSISAEASAIRAENAADQAVGGAVPKATALSTQNLNTIVKQGTYAQYEPVDILDSSNYPEKVEGILEVEGVSGGGGIQRYTTMTSENRVYYRTFEAGGLGWTDWSLGSGGGGSSDEYLLKAGDTATGEITFSKGLATKKISAIKSDGISGFLDFVGGNGFSFYAKEDLSGTAQLHVRKNFTVNHTDLIVYDKMLITATDDLSPEADQATGENVDGLWCDDGTNTFYFQCDTNYKSKTNLKSTVVAKEFRTESGIKLSEMPIFTQDLSPIGWCKLPNGLIIQWGLLANLLGTLETDFNFPISFPNMAFAISTALATNPVGSRIISTYIKDNASFTLTVDKPMLNFSFIALGW